MKSRKELLKSARLYVILDRRTCGRRDMASLAERIAAAGADIIQYRDTVSAYDTIAREAGRIRGVLSAQKTLFIVNNYPQIACAAGADGVHLGQKDCALREARRIVGEQQVIGASTHDPGQARTAVEQGADYLGYGPLFATATKPEYRPVGLERLAVLKEQSVVPVFVIGGLNRRNIKKVTALGIQRIALCRAILKSRNIEQAVQYYKKILSVTYQL